MVSVKQATAAARAFARDVLEPDQAGDLRLEEVESGIVNGSDAWLITLSMPQAQFVSALTGRRDYKTFTVRKEDGDIVSMKIRELAGA